MMTCVKCNRERAGNFWNGYCAECVNNSLIAPHRETELLEKISQLETENQVHQQALQTSQEWHQRQKAEIIAEWSNKYQSLIQKWKTTIQQELTLLRNLLNSHE